MEFQYFDGSGCGFPTPRVPLLAPLTLNLLGYKSTPIQLESIRSLGNDSSGVRTYARGRYALLDAYHLAGVGKTGALLAPSYHCRTMLDPALRLEAEIGFYPLKPDLTPDFEALDTCLNSCSMPVKALLVTHYFGFPQALDQLAMYCKRHGIALIEDCSHALFTVSNPEKQQIGKTGRYGVSSPYKFASCEDGGLLWANNGTELPPAPLRAPGATDEMKGVLNTLKRACAVQPALDIATLGQEIQTIAEKCPAPGLPDCRQGARLSIHYLPAQEKLKSLAWSRWVLRHTRVPHLAHLRRRNYQQWVDAVSGLPHCRALLPSLPDSCVPYMFPLFIDYPKAHFSLLKHLGMPIWRWDDMAISNCAVASSYRLQILHLPCHQALTNDQMRWMTTAVTTVMQQTQINVNEE